MDFRGQQKQQMSAAPQQPQTVQHPRESAPTATHRTSPGKRRVMTLVVGIVVLVVLSFAAWFVWQGNGSSPRNDRYQAVFLDDNQVFFGKLVGTHGEYLRLEKPYSTKAADIPEGATAEQKEAISNNLSLIKVADMVYGPEDVMMIRAEKVKYWQDLQPDSKVAKALSDAQKEN
jgi:hypothetical protein